MNGERARPEAGFALPLTIFVLTLVTIMLAALLVQVQGDRRIAESSGDLVEALTVAQSGLDRYFAHYDSLVNRPPDGDSLRFNVGGGYADVRAWVAFAPTDTLDGVTYVVRSTGHVIKPTQGADPQAVRTVAQYARWQYGSMKVTAAFTAINDFRQPCNPANCDGEVRLNGLDQCTPAGTPVWALRVPNGPTPAGVLVPPYSVPFGLETGNAASVSAETKIDWAAAVGPAFTPDYASLVDLGTWSSYRLGGNPTLTDVVGNGLLLVEGDLTLAGSHFLWDGVVLVGGRIGFEADTTRIRGAVISGLGVQTAPPNPAAGSWGLLGRDIDIAYASCNVVRAFSSLQGFAPVPNAWMEDWSSY